MVRDVTILTGFLGAGKTTVLNAIIATRTSTRFAIIENEFGAQGIDGELVLKPAAEIVELNDGCLCCSLSGALIDALDLLIKTPNPWDELIIECAGVADPSSVAMPFLLQPEVRAFFRLKTVICVIDAELIEDQLQKTEEAIVQMSFSDVLLINKSSHVNPSYIEKLKLNLTGINPFATVLSDLDGIPTDQLLSAERLSGFAADSKPVMTPAGLLNLSPYRNAKERIKSSVLNVTHNRHNHSNIESAVINFDNPFDLEKLVGRLRIFLFVQSNGIYRIKGLIESSGEPRKLIIQSVGTKLSIETGKEWEKEKEKVFKIVIFGKDLRLEGFEKMLGGCLANRKSVVG